MTLIWAYWLLLFPCLLITVPTEYKMNVTACWALLFLVFQITIDFQKEARTWVKCVHIAGAAVALVPTAFGLYECFTSKRSKWKRFVRSIKILVFAEEFDTREFKLKEKGGGTYCNWFKNETTYCHHQTTTCMVGKDSRIYDEFDPFDIELTGDVVLKVNLVEEPLFYQYYSETGENGLLLTSSEEYLEILLLGNNSDKIDIDQVNSMRFINSGNAKFLYIRTSRLFDINPDEVTYYCRDTSGNVTTQWYKGDETIDGVVEVRVDKDDNSYRIVCIMGYCQLLNWIYCITHIFKEKKFCCCITHPKTNNHCESLFGVVRGISEGCRIKVLDAKCYNMYEAS